MYLLLIVCALAATVTASYLPQSDFTVLEPYSTSPSGWSEGISSIGVNAENYQRDSVSVQKGAQLASIARSSALSAKNAVYSQNSAASQAEFGVKNTLASVAVGAAKAAQAALTGKQAIFSNLKQQLISAQNQLKEEINQYNQAKIATRSAQEAAHRAQSQVNTLRATLTEAESTAHNAAAAAAEASNAEATQKGMVFEAKQLIEHLLYQLKYVAGDLKDIEYSASKATSAAQVAKLNAINAAHKNTYLSYNYH